MEEEAHAGRGGAQDSLSNPAALACAAAEYGSYSALAEGRRRVPWSPHKQDVFGLGAVWRGARGHGSTRFPHLANPIPLISLFFSSFLSEAVILQGTIF